MSDECKHGFVDGLCATCNPKPVAEVAVASRTATRSRVAAPQRATVRSLRAAARVPERSVPAGNLLEQRIYHVTHVSNLSAILSSGAIVPGAVETFGLLPAELRTERSEIEVPGNPDLHLADYVPFFLAPDAALWRSLRDGNAHPRLSARALGADLYDFVFLVSTVRHVVNSGTEYLFADRNAEGASTRFATTREDAERMLQRLRAAQPGADVSEAELLVAQSVPLESITLVGVANDRVRQNVRDLMAEADYMPKIAVYPPWFQAAEL